MRRLALALALALLPGVVGAEGKGYPQIPVKNQLGTDQEGANGLVINKNDHANAWPSESTQMGLVLEDCSLYLASKGLGRELVWDWNTLPYTHRVGSISTAGGVPSEGETMTLHGIVYTFSADPTDAEYEIDIAATSDTQVDDIVAAINRTGTPGTDYHVGIAPHPTLSAADGGTDTVTLTARFAGPAGDSITLAESATNIAVTAMAVPSDSRRGCPVDRVSDYFAGKQTEPSNTNTSGATDVFYLTDQGNLGEEDILTDGEITAIEIFFQNITAGIGCDVEYCVGSRAGNNFSARECVSLRAEHDGENCGATIGESDDECKWYSSEGDFTALQIGVLDEIGVLVKNESAQNCRLEADNTTGPGFFSDALVDVPDPADPPFQLHSMTNSSSTVIRFQVRSTVSPKKTTEMSGFKRRVLYIGDSNSNEVRTPAEYTAETQSWPALLRADLWDEGFLVYGKGCSGGSAVTEWDPDGSDQSCGAAGEATRNNYEFFFRDIPKADLVVIVLGTNDFAETSEDASEYKAAMEALVVELQQDGHGPVLLFGQPWNYQYPGASSSDQNKWDNMRTAVTEICADRGNVYCPFDPWTLTQLAEDFEDSGSNVHWDASGHAKMAAAAANAVRSFTFPTQPAIGAR